MTDMNENNTDVQVELTVGEMLRNARTTGRRKREIPTISKQLCIREEFLQALEDGNYSVIPEPVYILGFARNYAMELGLNPDEIVNKLKHEMGLSNECQIHSEKEDKNDAAAAACESNAHHNAGASVREVFAAAWSYVRTHWKWFAAGVATLILLIVLVVVLASGAADEDAPADTSVVDNPVVAVSTEPAYNVAVRERFGTDNRAKANVILQANRDANETGAWVEVKDARGRTELSRVLLPGDVYYVPAGGKYTATFGNAGGIDVWVNGKLAPKVGANHARKSGIVLSPEKLMATAE
ncbi:MAG TPA: hypothetical protein DD611_03300 [Alphaproteobacteria bacterium]|nr:hypothetical protein [Alphaproteobacteria bacterium]